MWFFYGFGAIFEIFAFFLVAPIAGVLEVKEELKEVIEYRKLNWYKEYLKACEKQFALACQMRNYEKKYGAVELSYCRDGEIYYKHFLKHPGISCSKDSSGKMHSTFAESYKSGEVESYRKKYMRTLTIFSIAFLITCMITFAFTIYFIFQTIFNFSMDQLQELIAYIIFFILCIIVGITYIGLVGCTINCFCGNEVYVAKLDQVFIDHCNEILKDTSTCVEPSRLEIVKYSDFSHLEEHWNETYDVENFKSKFDKEKADTLLKYFKYVLIASTVFTLFMLGEVGVIPFYCCAWADMVLIFLGFLTLKQI